MSDSGVPHTLSPYSKNKNLILLVPQKKKTFLIQSLVGYISTKLNSLFSIHTHTYIYIYIKMLMLLLLFLPIMLYQHSMRTCVPYIYKYNLF